MVSTKLKKIIIQELDLEFNSYSLYKLNDSYWYINPDENIWLFELDLKSFESSVLWWKFDIFSDFFKFFSLPITSYEPLIVEWCFNKLKDKIINFDLPKQISPGGNLLKSDFDEILECGEKL